MAVITPNYTDGIQIIATQLLARGSIKTVTYDTVSANKADWFRIWVRIGRTGTTALSSPILVDVNALPNSGNSPGGRHPVGVPYGSSTAAASLSTTVNVDSASAQNQLKVASSSVNNGDYCVVTDAGFTTFNRTEFFKASRGASGIIYLKSTLLYTHTATQADAVLNGADVWSPCIVPGGAVYEVCVDYGPQTTGDSVIIDVMAEIETGFTVA
jgi:hypothetical protein